MTERLDQTMEQASNQDIIDQETMRDTNPNRTSSLRLDFTVDTLGRDITDDADGLLARTKGREDALHHLDEMLANLVCHIQPANPEGLDDALKQISLERQRERERLNQVPTHRKKHTIKRSQTAQESPSPDRRLDAYIDGVMERLRQGLALTETAIRHAGHGIKRAGGNVRRILRPLEEQGNKRLASITHRISQYSQPLTQKEKQISERLADFVTRTDLRIDDWAEGSLIVARRAISRWNQGRDWAENHKRSLLGAFAATSAVAAVVAVIIGNLTAYEYMYNGKVLGIVDNQKDVYNTIDMIGDKLTLAYGAEIQIDPMDDISFRKVVGTHLTIDDKDDVLNNFTYLKDMDATAYGIYVDGKRVATLDSEITARKLLDEVQDRFLKKSDTIQYKTIGFAEQVEIKEFNTKIGNINQEATALEYMLTGAVEKKVHAVESGETFNQIAKDYGLKPAELEASNPGVEAAKLHIGQELVLNQICPVVTVQTTEIATYTAAIDYTIQYQETSTLYKGEQTVKSRGIKGQREIVAEIVRNNGTEVSRNELSSKVISDPVSQVVLQGTKALPPLIGTGTFIYPTRGTLTSRFGTRWGRLHAGIDLAAPVGTKIRASDGGTVIYAGRDGALGLVVRINHGGNRTTVYGHCSKILVKVGDKVYQDQHIANVGNTGNSTGPHLHFEVRINGVAQNPLKYLN